MQKTIASSLLAVLLLPAAPAFAQFKTPIKATVNQLRLTRAVANVDRGVSRLGGHAWRVPAGLITGNRVPLTAATTNVRPDIDSPAFRNLLTYRDNALKKLLFYGGRKENLNAWIVTHWDMAHGKAFYNDQTALAKDLDAFYKGAGTVRIAPDGHTVKIYALPVDGILYMPFGYSSPVLLTSNEYFVVYDPQTKTGKLVENVRDAYTWFQLPKSSFDEIWKAMGSDKVFDDLNRLCDCVLMAHLHKAYLDQLRAQWITADVPSVVKDMRADIYKKLNTPHELVAYLTQLPKVRHTQKGFNAYVIELPVDGLTYVDHDGTRYVYNAKDHVMLYFEIGSAVGIVPRADIENPALFTPVK